MNRTYKSKTTEKKIEIFSSSNGHKWRIYDNPESSRGNFFMGIDKTPNHYIHNQDLRFSLDDENNTLLLYDTGIQEEFIWEI